MNLAQLIQRWQALSSREQILLLAGTATGIIIALVSFVWEPLTAKRAQLRIENSIAIKELNWMRQNIPDLLSLRAQKPQGQLTEERRQEGAVNRLLQGSARRMGLSFQRFQPGKDDSVRVWVKDADFNTLLKWLYEAEHKHNIRISDTNIVGSKQRGKVSGQVQLTY